MNRAVDWTPLVADGTDPVPGAPDQLTELAGRYRRVAAAIAQSAETLRTLAVPDATRSEAVDAFREQARSTADHVSRAYERYDRTGRALESYALDLGLAQTQSLTALQEAEHARTRMAAFDGQAQQAADQIAAAPAGSPVASLQDAEQQARGAADGARVALSEAQGILRRALALRDAAAASAVREMTSAREFGDLEDSVWDDLAEAVDVAVGVLDTVAIVAGTLALLVGWIPIIGQAAAAILGTIAAVAGVLSLIGNIYLWARGDAEWHDVALAAVGAASFGLGKLAAGAAKTSIGGVRGASRLVSSGGGGSASLQSFRGSLGLSRSEARALRLASQNQPGALSLARVPRTVRAMPGEFAEDVRTLRNADWGEVRAATRATVGTRPTGESFALRGLGEHALADELARARTAPQVVRESSEVMEHQAKVDAARTWMLRTGGYGVVDLSVVQFSWGQELKPRVMPEPPQVLNLPAPAGTGR